MNDTRSLFAAVALVCAAISSPKPQAVAADAPLSSLTPEDACILELELPPGATASVAGRDYGERRRLEFKPLRRGQVYSYPLTIRFPDGAEVQRQLLLQGGWRIRLPVLPAEQARPEPVLQTGHDIAAALISPDGRLAITFGDFAVNGNEIIVWDVATKRKLRTLAGGEQFICAAFGTDSRTLVTGSGEPAFLELFGIGSGKPHSVILWEIATGERLRSFSAMNERVNAVAMSPDGALIAAAGQSFDLQKKIGFAEAVVWDVMTGREIQKFTFLNENSASQIGFTSDGSQVVMVLGANRERLGGTSGEAAIWDIATGRKVRTLATIQGRVLTPMAISPDGRKIVTTSPEKQLLVTDVATGEQRGKIDVSDGYAVDDLAFSPDGLRILTIRKTFLLKGVKSPTRKPKIAAGIPAYCRPLLQPRTEQAAQQSEGLLVELVLPESSGEKSGLKVGDVILSVDQRDVVSELQLRRIVSSYHPQDVLLLDVLNNGQRRQVRVVLETVPDDDKYIAALRKSAQEGNARAQVLLAANYRIGTTVPRDNAEALKWCRLAAEQEHPDAQTQLGWMYKLGTGVPEDLSEANRWFRLAAAQGEAYAQFNLGDAYEHGLGVAKDLNEAARFYRLAAEQGHKEAQLRLGRFYENGAGVARDAGEAIRWYRLAFEDGFDIEAADGLSRLGQGEFSVELTWRDATSGIELQKFEEPFRSARSLSLSSDGMLGLLVTENGAHFVDASTGAVQSTLVSGKSITARGNVQFGNQSVFYPVRTDCIVAVDWTPRGIEAFLSHDDSRLSRWDLSAGHVLAEFAGCDPVVSRDRQYVLTRSSRTVTDLCDAATGRRLRTFEAEGAELAEDAVPSKSLFSPDSSSVLTIVFKGEKKPGELILWDVATGNELRRFVGLTGPITWARFSPGGEEVLAGCSPQGEILSWDTSTGRLKTKAKGSIENQIVSPDRRYLVVYGLKAGLYEIAKRSWRILAPESGDDARMTRFGGYPREQAAFSPNSQLLATVTNGRANWIGDLWEVNSGKKLRAFYGLGDGSQAISLSFSPDGRQLLTLSFDGIELWDTATGDRLLRVVAANGGTDWLAITPEGLFDGSEAGRQQVCYRIGGGLNVVPVDRFFQDFYRPGLVAALRNGERPVPDVQLGKSLPPLVKIAAPESGDVETPSVTLEVEAADQGGGISGLTLYQNGARVLAPGEKLRAGDRLRRSFRVALVEGENRLRVVSATADGSWESEPAEIVLRYAKPLAKSRLYVVAVGVNEYADANLNLSFAAKDARSLAELFQQRGKALYEQVHLSTLTDGQAVKGAIERALKQAADQTRPQDTLLLFLAGHGVMVGQRYYFIPHEFRKQAERLEDDIRQQGLPADELSDDLGAAAALKRILIVDTCAAGGALKSALAGRSGFELRGAIERLSRTQGIFTIAASAASEQAQEVQELGHGVLSYALLAGLEAVDAGPLAEKHVEPSRAEHVVDVMDWFSFAAGQVPRLTERYYGVSQEVQTSTQGVSFPVLPLKE